MSQCPFCNSEVAEIKILHLDLRICPHCFSTFFPCDQTMAFRSDLTDKSRELWLKALLAKNLKDPECKTPCCIDHGEPLVEGKLPDYGFAGKITTCCKMFHLPPSSTIQLLKRTLEHPFNPPSKDQKHHFFFIRWIFAIVDKLFGEKLPDEDPMDLIQYNLKLKKFLEPES
ncbi:MAG: hypothetical protein HUK20_13815 [Fibrobacter sp.]|nr:hypothetical protein [Fibrobacter sp.]